MVYLDDPLYKLLNFIDTFVTVEAIESTDPWYKRIPCMYRILIIHINIIKPFFLVENTFIHV